MHRPISAGAPRRFPLFFLLLCASFAAQANPSPNERPVLNLSPQQISLGKSAPTVEVDLWARIRSGMTLPERGHALVRTHENWYAARPATLANAIQRSRPYLYHIVEQIEKRGMPMEIALLPIIESGFNPMAESPRQASGIWQFIPSTGRVFGLKQNAWYDGRRDVLTATRAALDYLQVLHGMFGDWELALAAYNCGEGCVQRAVARNRAQGRGTDFASLDLPAETRHYVPKLLAVRNAILAPERFGIELDPIPNEPFFMQVSLKHPIEARTAARLADMPMDEFMALNPGFKRRVIYTDARDTLLIPADRIETFHFNLHRLGQEKPRLQIYNARRGETLDKIGDRFGVSADWLKQHNPIRTQQGRLADTQALLVPAQVSASSAPPPPSATPADSSTVEPRRAGRAAPRTHQIKRGDTLASVARQYNVGLADLRQHNANPRTLVPGQILVIPPDNS